MSLTTLYRTVDIVSQWIKYRQPTMLQLHLLGKYTDVIDYDFTALRVASESAAKYRIEHMLKAPNYKTDFDLREALVKEVHSQGSIFEFGVASGRSINHLARLFPNRQIQGFDSFEGLPETWTSYFKKGHFAQKVPKVRKNVTLHKGWFSDTLPNVTLATQNVTCDNQIALLHIDSDLYSSASYVLTELKPYIDAGTVILFDEYINYPGWEQHEFKAWQEFVAKYHVVYEYIGVCSRHQQVAIKVKAIYNDFD